MKYVQINSFYNGSTGSIMRSNHSRLISQGVDSYMFWGRRFDTDEPNGKCFTSQYSVLTHAVLARITDRCGFYSRHDTKLLLRTLEQIDPDVVHLHNLHGYYINVELLFDWLTNSRCQVKWTLHDCWPITGHCAYFTAAQCEKWKSGCCACPQKRSYPSSLFIDASSSNYLDKKRLFTSIPVDRMTLITPSNWLKNLVNQSYLGKYRVIVEENPIDRAVFKPTDSDFRETFDLMDKTIVLGVASRWGDVGGIDRKGFSKFLQLANSLDDSYRVVLVGLTEKQIEALPENVTGIARTESKKELAGLYTTADVFVSLSEEETFGMTVAEAQACGTPVIVREGTACEEIADKTSMLAVEDDLQEVVAAISKAKSMKDRNR